MRPLANGAAHGGAGFEQNEIEVPLVQVSGGGEADGTGTDDGDGERGVGGAIDFHNLFSFRLF
jgi:hypothetical protein